VVGADSELARSYCLETTNYASVIELARWEELGQKREAGIEIGSRQACRSVWQSSFSNLTHIFFGASVPGLRSASSRGLAERFNGQGFVVRYVENGIQPSHLQEVIDPTGEVDELQISALLSDGSECVDQRTQTRTIDVIDVGEIEENLVAILSEQLTSEIANRSGAFPKFDSSVDMHYGDAINQSCD
jgi:hypothetical protein